MYLWRGAWLLCCCRVVLEAAAGTTLWDVPVMSPNVSESLQWDPQCPHRRDEARVTADLPPTLDGTWVSTRCEVRPGPEFLLRSYSFLPTRHLQAVQHYYTDSSCGDPAYSLLIRGKLRLRQASWITLGGAETDHHVHKVGLVVHGPAARQRLASRLPPACGGAILSRAVLGKVLELYNSRAGRGCLTALGFSMMELGLVRVETQDPGPGGGKVQEMFLGDIHTQWTQRTVHRPTGYQPPLQNALHHVHPCPVCALVYRSSELRPPLLPQVLAPPLVLAGRWVSRRCESCPAALFLTRDFTFDPESHRWTGVYRHHSDPSCLRRTFTLRAAGHYAQGNPSSKIQGATELVFKVTQAWVAAFDPVTAKLLNATRPGTCGPSGAWGIGTERDVTSTHGCKALGVKLPHKEYELFRTERDRGKHGPLLLFTGDRPTDGTSPDRPHRRPTSFQAPLVRCSPEGEGGGSYSLQVQLPPLSGTGRRTGLSGLLLTLLVLSCDP